MKSIFLYLCLTLFLFSGTQVLATDKSQKNDYHKKSGMISSLEFSDMDGDKNGSVSFDEFKTAFPSTQKNVFDILDKDKDSQLNEIEWQNFKEMHKGMGG